MFITSCNNQRANTSGNLKPCVSVSLPVESYFVKCLCGETVDINVMVPQSVGHSDYTPLPSQMMLLADSKLYLAIGNLDFEMTWGDRIRNAGTQLKWVDLSEGISLIEHDDDQEEVQHGHHHHIDPHYWLAPREVQTMVANMARELKEIIPAETRHIDSALCVLNAKIDTLDARLTKIGEQGHQTFMIYHPALTYLAKDYGMTQCEIEKDGNAPTPKSYKDEMDKAKANGVKLVFVQSGYDRQKALSAAEMLGAKVVDFNPESERWEETMNIIINALDNETNRDTHQP